MSVMHQLAVRSRAVEEPWASGRHARPSWSANATWYTITVWGAGALLVTSTSLQLGLADRALGIGQQHGGIDQ